MIKLYPQIQWYYNHPKDKKNVVYWGAQGYHFLHSYHLEPPVKRIIILTGKQHHVWGQNQDLWRMVDVTPWNIANYKSMFNCIYHVIWLYDWLEWVEVWCELVMCYLLDANVELCGVLLT